MVSMPVVQIRQTYAKLGIDADLGKYTIKQPRPQVEISTKEATLDTKYREGNQSIDQSDAWAALGKGSASQFTERVASEAKNLALQGIAKRAEAGNRLWAIHQGGNPIADMAAESFFEDFKFNYEGPFSTAPVKIQYTPNRPEVQYQPGSVKIDVKVNHPEINYEKGKLDIYLQQRNSIELTPPQIDLRV